MNMIEYGHEWSRIFKQTLIHLPLYPHLQMFSSFLFNVWALCSSNSLSGPQAWTVMGKLLPGRQPKIRNHAWWYWHVYVVYIYIYVWWHIYIYIYMYNTHIIPYTPGSAASCCMWAFASNASRHIHFGPASVASGKSLHGYAHTVRCWCTCLDHFGPLFLYLSLSLTGCLFGFIWIIWSIGKGLQKAKTAAMRVSSKAIGKADIYLEQTCV